MMEFNFRIPRKRYSWARILVSRETKITLMGHFLLPGGSERMKGCRFAPCEPGLESSFLLRRNKKYPCGSFLLPGGSERMKGCRFAPCEPGLESSFLLRRNKKYPCGFFYFLAEARGFEPPIHCCIHAFQACSFNHSDTLPSG